jgi:hypothetical protein
VFLERHGVAVDDRAASVILPDNVRSHRVDGAYRMLPGAENSDVGGVHDADEEPGISGGLVGEVPVYVGAVPG